MITAYYQFVVRKCPPSPSNYGSRVHFFSYLFSVFLAKSFLPLSSDFLSESLDTDSLTLSFTESIDFFSSFLSSYFLFSFFSSLAIGFSSFFSTLAISFGFSSSFFSWSFICLANFTMAPLIVSL